MVRILLALLLLNAAPAMAVGLLDATSTSDGLLMLIRTSANSWNSVLRGYATDIFWSLVVIQFVWTFGQMALRKADFSELAAELVRFVVIIGFYAALLLYSVDWAQAIIDSFRKAAADAAGSPNQLQPGEMFGLAIELGKTAANVGLQDPVTAFVVALSATLIVLCFTFIAAFMMVTLIEAYVVINAGVFFMAFGGSQWTREYALAMLRYSVSVGAKLFVLHLIVGLIMTSARQWQAAYTPDETSMLTMVGLSLVCAYLTKTLPDMIQGLINGVSSGGGSQIGGMMAAGLAGAAAGAAAMSSMMSKGGMLGGAGKSVSDLIKSSFGSGGSGNSGGSGGSASPMNFMNSGGGGGSGGGSSASPRTGGGGHRPAPGTPPSAAPAPSAPSGNQSTASSSGGQASSGSAAGMPANPASNLHAAAHMATDAAVRGVGVMGSLAVPGMESAAGTSIGPAPTPPDLGEAVDGVGESPENIIRPASGSPVDMAADVHQAAPTSNPVEPMAATQKPIDTMKDLQQALTNQGKIS